MGSSYVYGHRRCHTVAAALPQATATALPSRKQAPPQSR